MKKAVAWQHLVKFEYFLLRGYREKYEFVAVSLTMVSQVIDAMNSDFLLKFFTDWGFEILLHYFISLVCSSGDMVFTYFLYGF